MKEKKLKTANEIELVDSSSAESADKIQSPRDANFESQPFDNTLESNQAGDETSLAQESPKEMASFIKANRTAPQEDNLVGKIIGGHYEILAFIGQGGMSRVYKAKHLLLKRYVAIKLLAFDRQFDSRSLARFQKEAEAAIELQHLNICSTREFGVNEEGSPFLVMDYLEGTSLADILSNETHLPQQRALDIMEGICAGLEHAHAAGVIHRDIKPANIILAKDKSGSEAVKIVDFGIAKLIREDESGPDLTQTGEVFGTPKYMSPEQCLGKKVDQRADIYALGCIFYEMLSGFPPFCNDSSIQILFAHVNDEPASLKPSCGKQVQAVLDRCLKKDASQRYLNVS
ncbi:MAG: serine/threonine protein kinase [Leptolyngbya sp.]|nr:serine/threonine protein kinase [Candidatus Melainabacteria bacterium]